MKKIMMGRDYQKNLFFFWSSLGKRGMCDGITLPVGERENLNQMKR